MRREAASLKTTSLEKVTKAVVVVLLSIVAVYSTAVVASTSTAFDACPYRSTCDLLSAVSSDLNTNRNISSDESPYSQVTISLFLCSSKRFTYTAVVDMSKDL